MAKVLISSLGTGPPDSNNTSSREYRKAVYKFEGSDKEYKTSFVATALSEHLEVDKIYLVGTSKSMWEEVYRYFSTVSNQLFDEDYWTDLGEKVESFRSGDPKINENDLENVNKAIDDYLRYLRSSASGGSHCYIIDYGLNERELWKNFDVIIRIGDNLNENDEIYLDITHSFRSIPLFNYLMLDLIRILKLKNDFKLSGLFYGMLDVIKEFDYAPIVDLSPLYNITLWARGAYNFINYGNGYLLADLINDDAVSRSIRNISDIVNINHIDEFKREIDRLNNLLDDTNSPELIIKYMQPFLMSFTDRFKGISSSGKLQLALAEWYFDNKRFAQGYICLVESVITRLLEIYRGKNSKIKVNQTNREKIKNLILYTPFKQRPEYKGLYEEYNIIREKRNVIAHAGYADENTYQNDISDANIHLNKVQKYVFNNKALEKLPEEFPFNKL
jgi:CRISPR-associated Csx2 family protein